MKDWKETELGKIGKDVRRSFKPNNEADLPYIGYEHIEQGTLRLLDFGSSKDIQSDKKYFKKGEIIFGTLRPYFRKVIITQFDGICSTDLAVINANKGYDQKFLFYILASQPLIDFADVSSNGTKMPRSKWSVLAKTLWNVPELPTQQRIASILSAYDDLIEVNNQRIKLLEQTARELYKEWFVRMRFPGYKQAKFKKGIPVDWVTEKFDKHIKIVRGKSYTSQEIDDNTGEYPFINLKNMSRGGGFRLDGTKYFTGKFKKEQIVKPGDIVMAVTDMTQDRLIVGRVARVPLTEHKEYVISLDIAKIIPLELPPEFLYSTLRFNYYGESLAELANGTNVLHLSPDLLKKYSLLIPPKTLTESFSEKVKPIYDLMDVLAIQNNHCRQIRDRLLPRLISGKLEVKQVTNQKAVMK